MTAQQKITMALLAAKLAKESLELLTMDSPGVARLQFRQIVADVKELDKHITGLNGG